MNMPLIIPDLQDSQMFALAQAAGRAGIPVSGTCWQMEPWAMKSKYLHNVVEMPCLSYVSESMYALQWKESGLAGVWLPCVDDITSFTAKYHELLTNAGMRFICPDSEMINRAELIHHEKFSGILQLPESFTEKVGLLYKEADHFNYPLMLKSQRNHFVCFDSAKMLRDFFDKHDMLKRPDTESTLQYYVKGDVSRMATAMVLFDGDGEVVRGFTGRRLKVEKTRFGPFGETLAAKAEWIPELYEGAVELLSAIGWKGFAEVECKQDESGQWHVLEINPRVSGWTCLAEVDGAGFLSAYYQMCVENVKLEEACLQRSKAEYQRLVATSYHTPVWIEGNSEDEPMTTRLKPLIRMMVGAYEPTLSFGAWDRYDLNASIFILWRTLKRAWNNYRLNLKYFS